MVSLLYHCILSWCVLFSGFHKARSFSIRLADGGGTFMGRVEVNMYDGAGWGTVCDDSWDAQDAEVVCRSLGISYREAVAVDKAYFGEGVGPTNMDDVTCSGRESSLKYCSFVNRTDENCSHLEDAGVICVISSIGSSFYAYIGDIDGKRTSRSDGLLMIRDYSGYHFNISVCDTHYRLQEAQVACHELGKDRYSSRIMPSVLNSHKARAAGFYLRLTFSCSGNESLLSSCSKKLSHGWCPNGGHINPGIICNYRQVKQVELYASKVSIRKILMMTDQQESIRCMIEHANPAPVLTWYINGWPSYCNVRNTTLRSGSSYKVDSILLLLPDTSIHGKELKCCSRDATGYQTCSDNYILFVQALPKLDIMSKPDTMNTSDTATRRGLICIGRHSRPKAALTWYKNGLPINASEGFSVQETLTSVSDQQYDMTSTLTIQDSSSYRNGDIFTCEASIESHSAKAMASSILLTHDPSATLHLMSDDGTLTTSTHIIAYCALGATSLLLVIMNICLVFHLRRIQRNSKSTTSDTAFTPNPSRSLESYENTVYNGNDEDSSVKQACYEQLQRPQLPTRKGKPLRNEEIYENTK